MKELFHLACEIAFALAQFERGTPNTRSVRQHGVSLRHLFPL